MNTLNLAESIFFTALEKETPEARAVYLDDACMGDANMRRYIERMLNSHPKLDGFLQQSPAPRVNEEPATIEPLIEERPGSIIGPYKLLQQLGEGGFGVVFMAEQEQPVRRKVALKIIKPGMDSKQVVARFEAERQALALMDHPNIARVFDGGTTDSGRPYFVMELVKGTPITEFCDKHRLTPRERLELFIPVCQAVQHAHQKGIIHRDIKPSNVLITMYDDKPVPKVIDFGIAKAIAEKLTEQTLFTRVGQVIGTLEYMSPEQATLNALDVDTRADVYALGVLLYELLTGSTPLNKERMEGVAFMEMLRLIREEEPPKPSTRLSQSGDALTSYALDRRTDRQKLPKMVKGELDWITMKALEKDRTRRYETANALASDVRRYLKDEQVAACPPSVTYRLQKYARKHKTAFAMTSMAAALLLFGIVATGWQAVRATHAEGEADAQRVIALESAKTARDQEAIARRERDEAAAANLHLHDAQQDLKRTLYFARANLLQNAWETNNTSQVFHLLNQQRPGPGERDLREFEWHYRDRMCHQDLLTIATLGSYWPERIIPAFSPDGKFVAAQAKPVEGKRSRGEIAIYSLADGSERNRVKLDAKLAIGSLQWSTDSKRVLIVQLSYSLLGIGISGIKETETRLEFVICDAADGHEISRVSLTDDAPASKGREFLSPDTAFSPDEKYFAMNSVPGKILLGDIATGKIIRQFGDSAGQPRHWAFSPDGRRLAAVIPVGELAGSSELLIKVWDTASGDELLSKKASGNVVNKIRFSPDGNRLAIVALMDFPQHRSSAFTAWDITRGKEMKAFPLTQEEKENDSGPRRSLNFFVFNPDTTRLAVYAGPGEIRLFDTATGEVVETIRNIPNMTDVNDSHGKFQTSPDGKMLAAGGSDGTVCVWDLGAGRAANGAPALVFRGHTSEIRRVEFHPDGSRLFSADMDGTVKVWHVVTRDRPVVIKEAANFAGPVAFSATSGRLLTVYHQRAPKAGNGKKGTPDEANKPGPVPMEKSKVTVWDLTGKPLASFAGPVPGVNGRGYHPIALSRDGSRLAIISFLGGAREGAELHVIETDTGKEVFMRKIDETGSLGMAAPAFSRDGKQIALGFAESAEGKQNFFPRSGPAHVKLLNSSDGTEIRRIAVGEGSINNLAFSPDGTRLALTTSGPGPKPKVSIWDVRTGARLIELEGLTPEALVFSDDGTRLAGVIRNFVFDEKNCVFVWDAVTGKTLLTLPGHSSRFLNIAFSPNGRRIATAMSTGPRYGSGAPGTLPGNEVKLWDAATGDELMTLKDLDRNRASHLSFSADGTRLYAVGWFGLFGRDEKIEIRTWDATPRR